MYSTKVDDRTMAKALGLSLSVSLKQSVEVCRFIKGRPYNKAVRLLEQVTLMKIAVPYFRFNRGGTGHRPGMAAGRYPVKTSAQILRLLRSAHSNARQKGLNVNSLIVKAAIARQGPKVFRYGRKRGRTAKRTHIEIVLEQTEAPGEEKKTKTDAKPKQETKPAAAIGKKAEVKKETGVEKPVAKPTKKGKKPAETPQQSLKSTTSDNRQEAKS